MALGKIYEMGLCLRRGRVSFVNNMIMIININEKNSKYRYDYNHS